MSQRQEKHDRRHNKKGTTGGEKESEAKSDIDETKKPYEKNIGGN